ncbi:hypothetical protein CfE428DRAFT_0111 [Chthoniobacter flavus Ellin428]|uniref:Type II secretion system protein GspG C-terminal domain-containing protein n=1 Tax=Chthoniobacter flavus Ellin428 TaxID=497964 RepID=B4CTU8_9BACT|nr:hypothetical protein CfE428DRAFT_0111 [Chthoniobacter flavus Ellin428]TCO89373.1 hypothetical protein EV701_114107 [Chthoniobacter flavus]
MWILWGCFLFPVFAAVLIPAYYIEEKTRGKMQWERYEMEAKGRGVKLDFIDFIPPKVPEAENFASMPVFEACAHAVDSGQSAPNPFELPKPTIGGIPKNSDSNKQKPVDLVAWQKYFVETKILPAAGDNVAADVLKALDTFADPLSQLREAGHRPHCRFPIHWEKGPGAELPQFEVLRAAAKLYALRLNAHLAIGDHAAACADFHDAMALVRVIRREPSMIAGLVRSATTVLMQNAVWDGLAEHRWTDADLRAIDADLVHLDWLDDELFSMASERAACNEVADIVIRRPHELDNLSKENDAEMKRFLSVYPTGWFYFSKLRMNRLFDEMAARVDPAGHRFHGDRKITHSAPSIVDPLERIRYMLFVVLTSVYEDGEAHFVHAAAMTDETRLACALERFRQARGEFPQTLGELTPQFIDRVPADVVNGEPYHYRLTDDGSFVLYSVGTNLRDDGGVIDPGLKWSKQLDWVWRYPAK